MARESTSGRSTSSEDAGAAAAIDGSADEATHQLVDRLFRRQAGQMVATLTSIFGLSRIDLAQDVVQEALITALRRWPYHGVPDNPTAWLIQVAKNRALDLLRREGAWEEKRPLVERRLRTSPEDAEQRIRFAHELEDDQLRLLFACCQPSLSRDAQVALTLKTVGGLGVEEIGRAFLVAESTVAQRLVRAKRRLRAAGAEPEIPAGEALERRLGAVLEVIYLLFNEGFASHRGEALVRQDLCGEAVRLVELLCRHPRTERPVTHALASLLLLQGSRLETRVDAAGDLLPLAEQDRSLWNRQWIGRGLAHLQAAGRGDELSTFHLEAEVAACHAVAARWAETDWPKIRQCYDALLARTGSPVVAVNRLVAVAETDGPEPALAALCELERDPRLADYYPGSALRGELEARLGRGEAAERSFARAAGQTVNETVRRYLERRRARLR